MLVACFYHVSAVDDAALQQVTRCFNHVAAVDDAALQQVTRCFNRVAAVDDAALQQVSVDGCAHCGNYTECADPSACCCRCITLIERMGRVDDHRATHGNTALDTAGL